MSNGVEVARAFVTIVPVAKGAQGAIANAIVPAATSSGKAAGIAAGAPMLAGITGALAKFVAPAAIFAGLALVGKKGVEAFQKVEEGANNVIKATGATGEQAKQLTDVYKRVSQNVVGDFGDIGSAVGEINTRLGLQGDELQSASEAMMKYAKVTGQDATAATKDVASMMRNAGIPTSELSATLGKLTVAGQAAGIDVAKLAQNTTKYNAVMKQLGLSTDEQIALMAKFEQSGADTASILNAMKKGVANWAKEGKDAKQEFAAFAQGVQDGTVTAGDAVEIFGARGGLSMYEAAQKGQLSFEDMFDAISTASGESLDTVYQDTLTASEKIDLAWQNITLASAEIFAPVATAFSNALDKYVLPFAQTVSSAFIEADSVLQGFGNLAQSAMGFFQNLVVGIIEGIPNAIDQFANFIDTALTALADGSGAMKTGGSEFFAKIAEAAKESWPKIKTALGNLLQTVGASIVRNAPTIAKNAAEMLGGLVKGIVKAIPGALKALGSGLLSLIKTIVQKAPQFLAKGGELVGKMASGISQKLPELPKKIGEGLTKAITAIVQKLPQFLAKGGEIVGKIVSGITSKIGEVPAKIGGGITNAIGKVTGAAGQFLSGGARLTSNLVSGIGTNIGQAAQKFGTAASNSITQVRNRFSGMQSAGSGMGGKLATGIGSQGGNVKGQASQIASKGYNGVLGLDTKWYWAGNNMSKSLATGIRSGQWAVISAAEAVASAAISAAKSRLKINSPSKVFIEIGKGINEGWSSGIDKTAGMTIDAVGETAKKAIKAGEIDPPSIEGITRASVLAAPSLSTGNYGAPIVNITGNTFEVSNDMDARQLAETIGTEVQRQLAGRVA